MGETKTSSKKSGTGSTSPTSDRKLTIPQNELPGSPCSVSKTGRKRVLHTGDDLGVKKPRNEDIISSDKSRPETEKGVKKPSKENLKSSNKSKPDTKGSKAANETQLKVQIQNLHYVQNCMGHPYNTVSVTHIGLYG